MTMQRYTQQADFWQERDFGGKISAAFELIGAQWRPLGKCVVYFVLPPTMMLAIGLSLLTNRFAAYMTSSQSGGARYASPFAGISWLGLGLFLVGILLTAVLLSATVYGYLRARLYLPATEEVKARHLWQVVRARLGWAVLAVLVLGFLGFVCFGILSAVAGLVGAALGPWGNALASLLNFGVLIYFNVTMSLYFPVLWLEDQGIFSAVGRSFQLIKGHWWITLGLVFVAGIIQNAVSLVFVVPLYAVFFGRGLHIPFMDSDLFTTIGLSISSIGLVVTYALPMLIMSFHYFGLVEQHDGTGSLLLLDQLGQAPATQPTLGADYYRPDEEGEY